MIPIKTDNPSKKAPILTIFIIAINLFIFIQELKVGLKYSIYRFGFVPYELTHFVDLPPYIDFPIHLTIITSLFLHGSWVHFLGNMWFLYIFGKNIEDWLGSFRFLLFYLVCGIGASLTHTLFNPLSKTPTVGASGAIAGVMGAYLILYPKAKVLCIIPFLFFIRIVLLPAFLFLIFWIMWQIFASMTIVVSPIAYWAHIGGFFIGIFFIKWFRFRKLKGWR